MITKFSTLYAGHVLEGEGIGFDGIPHDDRWYDNDRLAQVFDIAKDMAVQMDQLGYDILCYVDTPQFLCGLKPDPGCYNC